MNELRKAMTVLISCSVNIIIVLSSEQPDSIYQNFLRFSTLYSSGSFAAAEKCMLSVLDKNADLPDNYYIAALNNIGLVKKSTGLYQEAIEYYNKAEELIGDRKDMLTDLASIYNNKSRIYTFQKSFPTAIEYLEKTLSIYLGIKTPDKTVLQNLSTGYLNLGIIYFETGEYEPALKILEKSDSLKTLFRLPESELVFLNMAKAYSRIDNRVEARKYYQKSLNTMERKFGKDYYRISEVYFSYGEFLYETGRTPEALEAHQNALRICLDNYGKKHPLVSLAYKQMADYYFNQSEFSRSLEYYQNALISIDSKFNDHDFLTNPSIDSSLFELRLLDILRNKSRAMDLYASNETQDSIKIKLLSASLMTADLSFRLIDRIRNNYLTDESRMFLSKAERETYITGIRIAGRLYAITGDNSYRTTMYEIVQRAKAANLRNSIIAKEAYRIAGIPDSIRERQTRLASTISAYSMLISGASENQGRDTIILQNWKDELFNLNRKMEKLVTEIAETYPGYNNLVRKADPVPLNEIQKNLHKDETIIDYLITEPDARGSRELFSFVISGNDLQINEILLDTAFQKNAMIIKNSCLTPEYENFGPFENALCYMYEILIRPVEKWIKADKITIIPDEEISYLPFDVFIYGDNRSNMNDFGGVQFLVKKYSVSYSFSSSLILRKNTSGRLKMKVLSFVPFYESEDSQDNTVNELRGALNETRSIYKWFRGKRFEGRMATVDEFRKVIMKPAIFHLAMHSFSDTIDSRYSYLQFWTPDSVKQDGRLFNYEISLSEMNTPMVVLSACNSGSGKLYPGEGIVSIARGFILAGASSVVKTSWEVNDEVSAEIVSRYYKRLSEGNYKDESLRLAKLDYLRRTPPSYSHPYYWASYELIGDNSPLRGNDHGSKIVVFLLVISGCILILFYLRWRIIFPASRL